MDLEDLKEGAPYDPLLRCNKFKRATHVQRTLQSLKEFLQRFRSASEPPEFWKEEGDDWKS